MVGRSSAKWGREGGGDTCEVCAVSRPGFRPPCSRAGDGGER